MKGTEKQKRGFAVMSRERVVEIAKRGGAATKAENRSFSRNRDLAAEAGRKGGENSRGGGRPKKNNSLG